MKIGSHTLKNKLILAPMAGITDLPFRNLCRHYGAGLAISEMVASNPALRHHRRTQLKMNHQGENGLRSIQILGTDPLIMAKAAYFNQQQGADIIDINMGCPAKKVCAVAAGSALLKNETLVADILETVVKAVQIPVTLKIRTGWDKDHKNAIAIAKIAENSGISALTIHGRTRACKFNGIAEYDTIKNVKQQVKIPIIANGDITTPEQAAFVLHYTKADAIMIGRGAQGQPWIFNQFQQYLDGKKVSIPTTTHIYQTIVEHLQQLTQFYGETTGVRIARKHLKWYFERLKLPHNPTLYQATSAQQQQTLLQHSFNVFLN
ncbi:MAG: tRNA dihydrouridine synthase DusB [Methylococcales bacterium]|nr:tRNA dihydrouridine synthase DusB [Methylococcales bacterium]MCK5925656.1 tRNA dihydrouridine synthase DusB [Methylococcales bacterium]